MKEKNLTTIVTENRLMADAIAKAISASDTGSGYYLGNDYAVVWADDEAKSDTLSALWEMSHTVVNAMYPSIEGELSFLVLCANYGIPGKTHRAWLPDLTNNTIMKALENDAASSEEYREWIETETQLYPPLKEGQQEEIEDDIVIEKVRFTPLHNIVTLWLQSEKELGFDLPQTQKVALGLYAKKLISFPLVLQNGLPEEVWQNMRHVFKMVSFNPRWHSKTKRMHYLTRTPIFSEGESVFNGYGIVPTGLMPVGLSREEEAVYDMIVGRAIKALRFVKRKR